MAVIASAAGALVAVAAIVVAVVYWLMYGDARFPAAPSDIVVPGGSSVGDIARQLQSEGVVSDARWLNLYIRLHGGGERIQAAEYAFAPHETVARTAAVLFAGGRPPAVWVTIPEGFTAQQIAHRLAARGLVSSEADFMVMVRARALEGYLFPDTYLIPRGASVEAIADQMHAQFRRHLPRDAVQAAKRLRFSVAQIVTIASMVEREAKIDAERALIASVIYNRLRRGMPLEIDATVEYALPHYKAELSYADIAIDSPYNTYTHTGLPPGPISNPGRASLVAAFHPAASPFLYYVSKGNGHHAFSETLEEHQANVRKYLR